MFQLSYIQEFDICQSCTDGQTDRVENTLDAHFYRKSSHKNSRKLIYKINLMYILRRFKRVVFIFHLCWDKKNMHIILKMFAKQRSHRDSKLSFYLAYSMHNLFKTRMTWFIKVKFNQSNKIILNIPKHWTTFDLWKDGNFGKGQRKQNVVNCPRFKNT